MRHNHVCIPMLLFLTLVTVHSPDITFAQNVSSAHYSYNNSYSLCVKDTKSGEKRCTSGALPINDTLCVTTYGTIPFSMAMRCGSVYYQETESGPVGMVNTETKLYNESNSCSGHLFQQGEGSGEAPTAMALWNVNAFSSNPFNVSSELIASYTQSCGIRPDEPAGAPAYPDNITYGPNSYVVCPQNNQNTCTTGVLDTNVTVCVDISGNGPPASVLLYCPPITYNAGWTIGAANSYFWNSNNCDPWKMVQGGVIWLDAPSAPGDLVNVTNTMGEINYGVWNLYCVASVKSDTGSNNLSNGAIAGIAIGALMFCLAVAFGVVYYTRLAKRRGELPVTASHANYSTMS